MDSIPSWMTDKLTDWYSSSSILRAYNNYVSCSMQHGERVQSRRWIQLSVFQMESFILGESIFDSSADFFVIK